MGGMGQDAKPCAVCGELTASQWGVCQRTLACKRKLQRVHPSYTRKPKPKVKQVNEPMIDTATCYVCGGPGYVNDGRTALAHNPECRFFAAGGK